MHSDWSMRNTKGDRQFGILMSLELNDNQLTGRIVGHQQWCSCVLICDWLGPIPKEIDWLAAVKDLQLWSNQLSGMLDITSGVLVWCTVIGQGPIPKEIGNLKSLHTLSLGGSQLEGEKYGHLQWYPQVIHSDWPMRNLQGDRESGVVTIPLFAWKQIET